MSDYHVLTSCVVSLWVIGFSVYMSEHRCGILFPQRGNTPEDTEGCLLPNAHHGPHEFVSNGERYQWETDMGCDCESCQTDEPDDWCIVYSKLTDKRGEPC